MKIMWELLMIIFEILLVIFKWVLVGVSLYNYTKGNMDIAIYQLLVAVLMHLTVDNTVFFKDK